KVLITTSPVDTIAHKGPLAPIAGDVRHQGGPTPVSPLKSGDLTNLCKRSVTVVHLQHVAHELMIVPILEPQLVNIVRLESNERLQAIVIFRQHIRRKNFGKPIVVEICYVCSHRKHADVSRSGLNLLRKTARLIVDVEVVKLIKIVTY